MMDEKSPSPKTYVVVWLALLGLLLATVIIAKFVNFGWGNTFVAVTISAMKAFLVALFFMNLRHSSRYNLLFFGAGLFWLGILFVLSMSDFLTRGWIPIPGF
jgi:cytochrome c oxidase subunit IV